MPACNRLLNKLYVNVSYVTRYVFLFYVVIYSWEETELVSSLSHFRSRLPQYDQTDRRANTCIRLWRRTFTDVRGLSGKLQNISVQ